MSGTLATALAFARHGFPVLPLWQPMPHPKTGKLVCACQQGRRLPFARQSIPTGRPRPTARSRPSPIPASSRAGLHPAHPRPTSASSSRPACLVLDFDPRHGGELDDFEDEHGAIAAILAGADRLARLALLFPAARRRHHPRREIQPAGREQRPDLPRRRYPGARLICRRAAVPARLRAAPTSSTSTTIRPTWSSPRRPTGSSSGWPCARCRPRKAAPARARRMANDPHRADHRVSRRCRGIGRRAGACARIRDVKTAWHFLRTWNAIAAQPPLPERRDVENLRPHRRPGRGEAKWQ